MPSAQHPVFKQPADPGVSIWRYMDFTKFVSMLESRSLYFARSDKLGDPFEGSYSRGNQLLRPLVYKEIYDKVKPDMIERMDQSKAQMAKWQRKWTFINCWHMNPGDQTYVGTVEYIDFERDWMPEGNTFYPFVHKRRSFAHENEVRALFTQLPTTDQGFDMSTEPPETGIEKTIDVAQLVEQVYVAPTAPGWFMGLVQQVCKTYGLEKPVMQSSLDAQPFY
jgi:hypothetical protein